MVIQDVFGGIKDIKTIDELAFESKRKYDVSSFNRVLNPLIRKNDVVVIAGGYFGDEGKGKITDAVANCDLINLILRMNSGENAGHTVYSNGEKFVFNLTPSGILVPGLVNGIGPECVMDPVNYMNKEISQLVEKEVDYKDRLFIGNVHIVGPHHKIMDFALGKPNSSTLMGISYVHASKVRKKGIRLDDLFNDKEKLVKRLNSDLDTYHALMKYHEKDESQVKDALMAEMEKRGKKAPQHLIDFLSAINKVDFLIDLYYREVVQNDNFPQRADVAQLAREYLKKGKKIGLECPQSFCLSNATEKHWGSSTSAQTHAAGVLASANINTSKYKYIIINVEKTPGDSRVGIGANPSSFVPQDYFSKDGINSMKDLDGKCTDFDAIQRLYFSSIQENGILNPVEYKDGSGTYLINEAMSIAGSRKFGEKGATTGKPRVIGLFDCLMAHLVNDIQGPYVSISAMDRGDHMDKIGMTVAYVFHNPRGEILDSNGIRYNNGDLIRPGDAYPCDHVLEHCYPIIKVMDGWKSTPIGSDKRKKNEPLPENVQKFIGTIEDITGLQVISIGNGPDTKDLIYIKEG